MVSTLEWSYRLLSPSEQLLYHRLSAFQGTFSLLAAEAAGGQLIGVYHSHTHTDPRPSPTDVAQAPDPDWHYVLVSLRDVHPSVRSWRIRDGKIIEEPLVLQW